MAKTNDGKKVELSERQLDDLGLIFSFVNKSRPAMHGKNLDNVLYKMPKEIVDAVKNYMNFVDSEDVLYKSCFDNDEFSINKATNKILNISLSFKNERSDEFNFLLDMIIDHELFSEFIKELKLKKKFVKLKNFYKQKLLLKIFERVDLSKDVLEFIKSSYFSGEEKALFLKALLIDGKYDNIEKQEFAIEFSEQNSREVLIALARFAPFEHLPFYLYIDDKKARSIMLKRFQRGY